MTIPINLLAFFVLIGCGFVAYKSKALILRQEPLFATTSSKTVALLHIVSMGIALYEILRSGFDLPSFLLVQIILTGSLLMVNRRFSLGVNILRISFIFTLVYVAIFLVSMPNVLTGIALLLYLFSALYIQSHINMLRHFPPTQTKINKRYNV
jgi:hypothetical protein